MIAAETKRLADLVPFSTDILVLYVNEEVRPKYDGGDTFDGGSQRGRAWIWSAKTHQVTCASEFVGTSPADVTARIYDQRSPGTDVSVALTLALSRASERSAIANLVAAGLPKPP